MRKISKPPRRRRPAISAIIPVDLLDHLDRFAERTRRHRTGALVLLLEAGFAQLGDPVPSAPTAAERQAVTA